MAAPMTHVVVTFGIRAFFLFVLGMAFSKMELFWIYFWGALMDFADHFTSPDYVRDIMLVRIPRFFKGGDVGKPTMGVKVPVCWFHLWPGLVMSFVCGLVFFRQLWWVPLVFWFVHIMVDRYQKNDWTFPYESFFHPWGKPWVRKWGYPTKIRKEILISTVLMFFVGLFEVWWNLIR